LKNFKIPDVKNEIVKHGYAMNCYNVYSYAYSDIFLS